MTAKRAADRATVQVNFRMPPALAEWLDQEARRRGVSQTALLIEALERLRNEKR